MDASHFAPLRGRSLKPVVYTAYPGESLNWAPWMQMQANDLGYVCINPEMALPYFQNAKAKRGYKPGVLAPCVALVQRCDELWIYAKSADVRSPQALANTLKEGVLIELLAYLGARNAGSPPIVRLVPLLDIQEQSEEAPVHMPFPDRPNWLPEAASTFAELVDFRVPIALAPQLIADTLAAVEPAVYARVRSYLGQLDDFQSGELDLQWWEANGNTSTFVSCAPDCHKYYKWWLDEMLKTSADDELRPQALLDPLSLANPAYSSRNYSSHLRSLGFDPRSSEFKDAVALEQRVDRLTLLAMSRYVNYLLVDINERVRGDRVMLPSEEQQLDSDFVAFQAAYSVWRLSSATTFEAMGVPKFATPERWQIGQTTGP